MTETITAAGLTAVPMGESEALPSAPLLDADRLAELERDLALNAHDRRLWEFFRHRILPVLSKYHPGEPARDGHRPMVEDLIGFARSWQPDLVLWDCSHYAASIAARSCGAASARLMVGVDYWAWSRELVRERLADRTTGAARDPVLELVRPMAERFGCQADDELLLGQWTVDPTPPAMQLPLPVPYVPVRSVPYSGATTVPPWLYEEPKRPRVCLTVGLSGRERLVAAGVPLPDLLDGLAELDIEIVATLNTDQLDPAYRPPENVRVVEYLPLDLLLPTCAAIIHHGGPGTAGAAVAAGVPQLVTGALSSWDNGASDPVARHIRSRGAGLALDRERFSVASLQSALLRILQEPSFGEGAAGLYADWLAVPTPAELVPTLERLTDLYRK
ncbi:DUF1205 domain-containing protein [Streptomyces sp. ST2-7A]|nr:nucleotide disphospho-sugar-binding domain-containing protein [Streptomyces sp. ST2-7A]MCE7082469.1 DUF1205 domain-containing protein [Streptomyces sp. ST2-7A]